MIFPTDVQTLESHTDQIQNKTRKIVDAFEMFYSKCVMFLSLLLSGLPRDWRFQVFIT